MFDWRRLGDFIYTKVLWLVGGNAVVWLIAYLGLSPTISDELWGNITTIFSSAVIITTLGASVLIHVVAIRSVTTVVVP